MSGPFSAWSFSVTRPAFPDAPWDEVAVSRRPRSPQAFDEALGRRLRELRRARGVTQERLAEHLGISPQQLQKYEGGLSRISAARLQQICVVLGASAGLLLDPETAAPRSLTSAALADAIERLPSGSRALVAGLVVALAGGRRS